MRCFIWLFTKKKSPSSIVCYFCLLHFLTRGGDFCSDDAHNDCFLYRLNAVQHVWIGRGLIKTATVPEAKMVMTLELAERVRLGGTPAVIAGEP